MRLLQSGITLQFVDVPRNRAIAIINVVNPMLKTTTASTALRLQP